MSWLETKAQLAGETRLTRDELQKIPPATLRQLGESAVSGYRHTEMNELLPQLLGNGISPERAYEILRARYDNGSNGVPDDEIKSLINYHSRNAYRSSSHAFGGLSTRPFVMPDPRPRETPEQARKRKTLEAIARVETFVGTPPRGTVNDLVRSSPVSTRRFTKGHEQANFFFWLAHPDPASFVNVVANYTLDSKGKASPVGGGHTLSAKDWRSQFSRGLVPQSNAGCWFRSNPVKATGSGAGGSYRDSDVLAVRRVILESDLLPLDLQASFFLKAIRRGLPVFAIVDSGGKSLQAHVTIADCDEAVRIVSKLSRFGFDQANKNASRLCRLPGAVRKIGARDPAHGTLQRLVYLDGGK